MRSAMRLRMLARAVVEVSPHAVLAACAASSASSMSSALERATWVSTLPVIGVVLSKYWPLRGATHWPPM
ncbi:hypothetical protein D3C71_965700 [compost metagenome]